MADLGDISRVRTTVPSVARSSWRSGVIRDWGSVAGVGLPRTQSSMGPNTMLGNIGQRVFDLRAPASGMGTGEVNWPFISTAVPRFEKGGGGGGSTGTRAYGFISE